MRKKENSVFPATGNNLAKVNGSVSYGHTSIVSKVIRPKRVAIYLDELKSLKSKSDLVARFSQKNSDPGNLLGTIKYEDEL